MRIDNIERSLGLNKKANTDKEIKEFLSYALNTNTIDITTKSKLLGCLKEFEIEA